MPKKLTKPKILKSLSEFYAPTGAERVGFVLKNGDIVESLNIAPDPEEGFMVSAATLLECLETAIASWHTHPGTKSELSEADKVAFANWPEMEHYIVGTDGIKCYEVVDSNVREKRW